MYRGHPIIVPPRETFIVYASDDDDDNRYMMDEDDVPLPNEDQSVHDDDVPPTEIVPSQSPPKRNDSFKRLVNRSTFKRQ